MENFVDISDTLINDFIKIRENYLSSLINPSKIIIDNFLEVYNNIKEVNKNTSFLFNPLLKYFSINETLHSYMLADLLNPNSDHGQEKLFLNSFLRKLNIFEPETGSWIITAEKGRIDILLKRENPHSVIIIENKSNNAIDQDHQLYRYWYQEIYLKKNDAMFAKKETYDINDIKSRYKILYLPPDDSKEPNELSLTKPDYLTDNILPNKIPLNYELITFDKFICKWLKECVQNLKAENHRLRQYIEQYIELWT